MPEGIFRHMANGWQSSRVARRVKDAGTAAATVVRKHRPDYQIVMYMALLMLLGLVVMYAIGPQRANFLNMVENTDFYTDSYFVMKQGISLAIALVVFVAMAKIPYEFVAKHASKLLIAALALCALLVLVGNIIHIEQLALCTKGACRWFVIPGFGTLQPAEVLKFGMLLFMAGFLGMRAQQGLINDRDKTLIPLGLVAAAAMFFVIIMQKDLGTGISMTSIILAMLFVANMKMRVFGMILGLLLLAGVGMILSAPHRIDRVMTFFDGDSASVEDAGGYHIAHAKIAIGTGGLTGLGIGNSVQASGYLPESINDSVFAIMGETFGFVGLVAVLCLFGALMLRLLRVSDHLVDMRYRLLVAGVFGWVGSHVILNIAAMTGLVPLTGITLPLLSFGGTSMMFIAAALGLAFQLSQYTTFGSTLEGNGKEKSQGVGGRRRVGRPRYTSSRGTTRTPSHPPGR